MEPRKGDVRARGNGWDFFDGTRWLILSDPAILAKLAPYYQAARTPEGLFLFDRKTDERVPAENVFGRPAAPPAEMQSWWPKSELGTQLWAAIQKDIADQRLVEALQAYNLVIDAVRKGGHGEDARVALEAAQGNQTLPIPIWWNESVFGPFSRQPFRSTDDVEAFRGFAAEGNYGPDVAAQVKAFGPSQSGPDKITYETKNGTTYMIVTNKEGKITLVQAVPAPPTELKVQEIDGQRFAIGPNGQFTALPEEPRDAKLFQLGDLLLTQTADGSFHLLDKGAGKPEVVTLDGQKFIQLGSTLQAFPEQLGQAERRRKAILTLDEQVDEALVSGNFDYARALANVRDRPTQMDLFDKAMQFATAPGDALILQNIQRGLAEVERKPGELARLPRSAFLTEQFAKLTADPFAAQELLSPPPNIQQEHAVGRLTRAQQILDQIQQVEGRLAELQRMGGAAGAGQGGQGGVVGGPPTRPVPVGPVGGPTAGLVPVDPGQPIGIVGGPTGGLLGPPFITPDVGGFDPVLGGRNLFQPPFELDSLAIKRALNFGQFPF